MDSEIKCSHCGWEGDLDDRVPASAEWIAENDVDEDHFTGNKLNCPDCGESSAWILNEDLRDEAEDDDPFGND